LVIEPSDASYISFNGLFLSYSQLGARVPESEILVTVEV